jgi:diaminopimelate decarboxylase
MAEAPWPGGAAFGAEGLTIRGRTAASLARDFGTPLVVVDEESFRARCRELLEAFPGAMWAVKAFPAPALIRIAAEEGLDLLAATGEEIAACLRAGVRGQRIAFHGSNKLDEELSLALGAGVGLVVLDGEEDAARVDAAAAAAAGSITALLRLAPGVEAGSHEYVATGGADSRFGVSATGGAAIRALKAILDRPHLEVAGVHVHVGSQLLDPDPYLASLEVALDVLAEARASLGFEARLLDLGGGMGVRYTEEDPPSFAPLARELRARLAEGCRARDLPLPELLVEPGRAVSANAAVTLYRVGSVKETPGGRTFVAVDGGMSDNPRPALYDARYAMALASRVGTEPPRPCTVVGRHCESGDLLGRDVPLPGDVQRGDLLAVAATGAYEYAMASNYNRVGRPAVILVSPRRAAPILRREDQADLARLEVVPDPLDEAPPPDGVQIRPAVPRDARDVMGLIAAVADERRFIRTERLSQPPGEFRRRLRRSWTHERAELVAVTEGRVIGHLGLLRETGNLAHVASLGMAVHRSWRGRGVGSALMAEAIRWARWTGVEKLTLSVFPRNAGALALYRKFGFVEEGRLRAHTRKAYGDEDEVVMARWV